MRDQVAQYQQIYTHKSDFLKMSQIDMIVTF
jgi:hypothetical protein